MLYNCSKLERETMNNNSSENALALIKSRFQSLSRSEKNVASWLLENPNEIRTLSMAEIASICGVSDTTVLRMCRTIGFNGFTDLKISVLQNIVKPTQLIHDDVNPEDDTMTVTKKVFAADIQSLYDTIDMLDAEVFNQTLKAIKDAKSILIAGMGSSALLAQHGYQQLKRLGINCSAPADAHMQVIEASMLNSKDLTIGISFSGASRNVIDVIRTAKGRGAGIIAITGNSKSPLAEEADHVLLSVSHETRTDTVTGRIAQMAILDALYVNLSLTDPDDTLEKERIITSSILQKLNS